MAWIFNPNEFEAQDFSIVPVGNHRVRIADVVEKTFNSGNSGYEITLSVSGQSSKLWFYLVIDPSDSKKTNQRVGSFFESFGITDYDTSHYRNWVGKVGGVKVKHEEYNGSTSAKVAFCISKKEQEKLPPAQFGDTAPATAVPNMGFNASDLPFEM